jgi:hypothetical protein
MSMPAVVRASAQSRVNAEMVARAMPELPAANGTPNSAATDSGPGQLAPTVPPLQLAPIQRDSNFFDPSGGSQPAYGPGTNPIAPGLGQNQPGIPGMAFGGAPGLLAPNADAAGVPYDVPGTDWKAGVKPIALPLDRPMPQANIPKPEKIPGWKAPIPPHEEQAGPFKVMVPGNPDYIVTSHSAMIKSAWTYYLYNVCGEVESTWNSGVASINSFTQAAGGTGNESIEMLLKDMKPAAKWDLSANQPGKGSMAQQADVSSAKTTGAGPVSDVAKQVGALTYVPSPQLNKDTDFTKSLQATGSAGGPVQKAMQKAQTAHESYFQQLERCPTAAKALSGAADTLREKALHMEAKKLDETQENLEQQKKDIESGKAGLLAQISPQLADLFAQCSDIYEKVNKVVEASHLDKVAEALEKGSKLGAAKEAATGVLALIKMEKLEEIDKKIADAVAQKKSLLDQATVAGYEGARKAFDAALANMKTEAEAVDTKARDERNAMTDLADAVEKNWKGQTGDATKDQQQAKLAAGAIRALPIANKILSLVQEVRKNVPTKLPEASGFNSDKAHTLATQGIGAPGDAELVTTAGWILGIQPAIDDEIEKWEGIVGQLQIVVSKLGLQI